MAEKNQGQGRVTDPENDRRLKDNPGGQQQQGQERQSDRRQGDSGQGDVKDPQNDRRLKDNR